MLEVIGAGAARLEGSERGAAIEGVRPRPAFTVRVRKNASSAAMYCSRFAAGQVRIAAAFDAGSRGIAWRASAVATATTKAASGDV